MSTMMKISSRNLPSIRRRSLVKGGLAGILASGLAPTFARAETKKLVMAHLNAIPESAAVAFDWQAAEVRKRSNGELDMQFFGSTLITKEIDIMNAVKSGNIAIGNPVRRRRDGVPRDGRVPGAYLFRPTTRPTRCSTARSAISSTRSSRKSTASRSCATSTTASAISGTASARSRSPAICAA